MDTAEAQCNEDADDSPNYRARVARLSGDGLSDDRSHESRSHRCDPSLGNRIDRELRDSGLASSGRDELCNDRSLHITIEQTVLKKTLFMAAKKLNNRQIATLFWISQGCPSDINPPASYKASARMLDGHGLVKVSGHGGS